MKKLILLFAISLIAQISLAQKNESTKESATEQKSIYFATAKHAISPESEAVLNDILPFLQQFDTYEITIQGNTDDKGNTQYNQALSERRANAVKKYLQERGIDETKLRIAAYGEEKPLADNTNDEGKQKNRRVDIYITGVKKVVIKKEIIKKQPAKPIVIEQAVVIKDTVKPEFIGETLKKITPRIDSFEIDPNKDAVIRGKQGTIVYIKAGTFKTKKDCKVNFILQEIFTKADMIGANVATQNSNGALLETGGMTYTAAKDCKGNVLKIQKGKDLVISIPTDTIRPNMGVFNGTTRNPHDSTVMWTINNNSVLDNFNVEDVLYCKDELDWVYRRCGLEEPCVKLCGYGIMDCCSICCGFESKECKKWIWYKNPLVIYPEDGINGLFFKPQRYANKSRFYGHHACQLNIKIQENTYKIRRLQQNNGSKEKIKALEEKNKILYVRCATFNAKHQYWQAKFDTITGVIAWRDSIRKLQIANYPKMQRMVDSINGLFAPTPTFDKNRLGQCYNLKLLYDKYEVTNIEDLAYAINKPLMVKFGVTTIPALRKAIAEKNIKDIEVSYKNKSIAFTDLKYYVFNTTRMGYHNLDIFSNKDDLVTMKLDQKTGKNIVCKLVFKLENSVVASSIETYAKEGERYIFQGVPRNTPVWIVAIKSENGKPFLSIEETTIQAKTYKISWQEMTIETLKQRLKILDL